MKGQKFRSKFRIYLYVAFLQSERLKHHSSAMYPVKLTIIFIITELCWLTLWTGSLHEYERLGRVTYKRIGGVITRINNFECESFLDISSIAQAVHTMSSSWTVETTFYQKGIEREKETERKESKKRSNQEDTLCCYFLPVFNWYNNEISKTTFKALHYIPIVFIWFASRVFFCGGSF